MVFECTKGNVLIFTRAGNGLQRVFWTHFERGNVFKMKAGEKKQKQKYTITTMFF